jgi:hypothetical protein
LANPVASSVSGHSSTAHSVTASSHSNTTTTAESLKAAAATNTTATPTNNSAVASAKRATLTNKQVKKWDKPNGDHIKRHQTTTTTIAVNGLAPVQKVKSATRPVFKPATTSGHLITSTAPFVNSSTNRARAPSIVRSPPVEYVIVESDMYAPSRYRRMKSMADVPLGSPKQCTDTVPIMQPHLMQQQQIPFERPRTTLKVGGEGDFHTVMKDSYKNFRIVSQHESSLSDEPLHYCKHVSGHFFPDCEACIQTVAEVRYQQMLQSQPSEEQQQQNVIQMPTPPSSANECGQNVHFIDGNESMPTSDNYTVTEPIETEVIKINPPVETAELHTTVESGDRATSNKPGSCATNVWTAVNCRPKPIRPQSSLTVSGRFKQHLANQPDPAGQQRRHVPSTQPELEEPSEEAQILSPAPVAVSCNAEPTKQSKATEVSAMVAEARNTIDPDGNVLICDHCRAHQLGHTIDHKSIDSKHS